MADFPLFIGGLSFLPSWLELRPWEGLSLDIVVWKLTMLELALELGIKAFRNWNEIHLVSDREISTFTYSHIPVSSCSTLQIILIFLQCKFFKWTNLASFFFIFVLGSGCGTVCSAVRGPGFESSRRQLLLNNFLLLKADSHLPPRSALSAVDCVNAEIENFLSLCRLQLSTAESALVWMSLDCLLKRRK